MLIFLSVPPPDPFADVASTSTGSDAAAGFTASLAPTGGTPLRACLVTPSGYQGATSPSRSHRHHGMVDAKDLAKHAAHFADGGMRSERRAHQREEVGRPHRPGTQCVE
jgi:hypothetical protein